MANGAFTLQGFESPEEVQARIGKVKQAAIAQSLKGDIGDVLGQQAFRQAGGALQGIGALASGQGAQEDPLITKARTRQALLQNTDFTDRDSIKNAINAAGNDTELKVKLAEMHKGLAPKVTKRGIKEIKVDNLIKTYQLKADGTLGELLSTADRFSPESLGLTGAGETALQKSIGKAKGRQIVESQTSAKKANIGLKTATDAQTLLREGITTGAFANVKIGAAAVAKSLGFNVGTDLENTQAFMAKMGTATLDILGSGALGAGTGISDNDRKFAKQIAGGEITLDENAIKRIIDLNAKVNQNIITNHNKDFETVRKQSPVDLSVKVNPWKSFADFDKEAKVKNAQALNWAKKNPNDPRAALIIQKIGNQ